MELNKIHRECLLNELDNTKKDLDIQERCFNKAEDERLINHYEIQLFLLRSKVSLIEKSLIDNEIDF